MFTCAGFLEFVQRAFLGLRQGTGSAGMERCCQQGWLGTEAASLLPQVTRWRVHTQKSTHPRRTFIKQLPHMHFILGKALWGESNKFLSSHQEPVLKTKERHLLKKDTLFYVPM